MKARNKATQNTLVDIILSAMMVESQLCFDSKARMISVGKCAFTAGPASDAFWDANLPIG